MKFILYLLIFITSSVNIQSAARFMTDPAISSDASQVVFSYEDDLWIVPLSGGTATRITGMDGRESNPVFSPDGKYIAFTGRQDGNPNIYVVPVNGGNITQLTFNDASDICESWSWDSKFIYFNSNRYNQISAYKVSVSGGTPVRLFEHYFNFPHNVTEHPITNEIFFNDSFESSVFVNRKRYKGDFNPDIRSYNLSNKEYKVYTSYHGKDLWPMIDSKGNIFFVSDEFNDEYNLYALKDGKPEQLTSFDNSVYRPKLSANGEKIVFELEYQIYSYDVASKKSELIKINIFDNNALELEKSFNVKGKISAFDISPDNKKIAFVSRGELFISDIEGKFVKKIKTDPKERISEAVWMKDNKTIFFNQTYEGYLNWFSIKVDQAEKEIQITKELRNNRNITFSSDRSKGLYFSGRDELRLISFENYESDLLVKDEFWALYESPAYFSPDDKYVLYSAYRDFEKDIFVFDLENKKSEHITKTGVTEDGQFWSPDGKYIYFSSDRFNPGYPRGQKDSDIFRIALTKFSDEFKSNKIEKLFSSDEEEKKDSISEKIKVVIDFKGLNDRWEEVETLPGNQDSPFVIIKDNVTNVFFTSKHDNEARNIWKKTYKPFEKPETKKIEGAKTGNSAIVESKGNYYILFEGNINKLKLSENKTEKIEMDFSFDRNMADEFSQMFYETWANVEENFYDNTFHGVDWKNIKVKYEKYLPSIRIRNDLRLLLNDMLGELNSSHQGFSSGGDEEKTFYEMKTAYIGILFDDINPYKVKSIVSRSAADKSDINVLPGDILIEINGEKVDQNINRNKYFTFTKIPDELTLKFRRENEEKSVKIHPQDRGQLLNNLYDEWVDWNQKFVDEKSDKKIAYVHMKNMGDGELNNFLIEMTNESKYRDGLILDLRYNRGGNVHDDVLNFLMQKPYLQWKYREGNFAPQPNFAPAAKPIVILVNEQSLSDAEMTAAGFKELKLGKIIGTETYRWLIFTSGKSLVDGSFYRLPSWGCYTLDGNNIEFDGVKPDIYIQTSFKDRLEGKDPQLQKAINEILGELK